MCNLLLPHLSGSSPSAEREASTLGTQGEGIVVGAFAPRWFLILGVLLFTTVGAKAADSSALLADAMQSGRLDRVRGLLDRGEVEIDAAQADGMTALHWAVYRDDLDGTEMLLEAGADASVANRYGVEPLSLACQNGNAKIVKRLLEAGADANAELRGGETVLMTASRTGVLEVVRDLIASGAMVNATERNGQTAIMWAAAAGHADVVDALIDAGADFRQTLRSGFNPFFFAVRQGHIDVVLRLLAAGVDVNEPIDPARKAGNGPAGGTSSLLLAVENGHFELAEVLLREGADARDPRLGYTALHAITWVRKPLRGDGDPPPIGSGSTSSLELVRSLVAHGADVNAVHGKHPAGNYRLNRTGATPFLLAAETGDIPLMKLLLELGADPTIANADHVTPLLAASGVGVLSNGDETAGTEEEAIQAVQLLLDLGADINAVDDQGKTAMHGAAFKSWTKLVQFLADHGADVNVWNRENSRGWTPLLIAQGHRPGNFRPSVETIEAVVRVMRAAGVEPPDGQPARP
jgi:ankyrin repeat protein